MKCLSKISLSYIVWWNTSRNIHTLTHPCIWQVTCVTKTSECDSNSITRETYTRWSVRVTDYYLSVKLQCDLAAATGSTSRFVQIICGAYAVMLIHIAKYWSWRLNVSNVRNVGCVSRVWIFVWNTFCSIGVFCTQVCFCAYISGRDRSTTVVKHHGSDFTHHNHPDTHLDQTNWHEGALEAGTCGTHIICDVIRGADLRDYSRQGSMAVCTRSDNLRCVQPQRWQRKAGTD